MPRIFFHQGLLFAGLGLTGLGVWIEVLKLWVGTDVGDDIGVDFWLGFGVNVEGCDGLVFHVLSSLTACCTWVWLGVSTFWDGAGRFIVLGIRM